MKFGYFRAVDALYFRWGVIALIAFGIPAVSSARPGMVQAESVPQLNQQAIQPSDEESELQTGIVLTKEGQFAEAIPHFLVARGHVREEYAVEFNLALCYVATSRSWSATMAEIGIAGWKFS